VTGSGLEVQLTTRVPVRVFVFVFVFVCVCTNARDNAKVGVFVRLCA
jgi:hypothetical protein